MADQVEPSEINCHSNSPSSSEAQGSMELQRSLRYPHAVAYVVGLIFGSGIFISPGLVAKQTNNMGIALLLWIISGTICTFGALCLCELASALKKTGGIYIFIKEAYGNLAGFCIMWAQTFIIYPAAMAISAVTFGVYCVTPFYDAREFTGIWLVKVVAIFCLFVSLIINSVRISFVAKTQVFFTVVQVLALVFFMVVGLWKAATENTKNYESMFKMETEFEAANLGLAFFNCLWAFDAWDLICNMTEETVNPEKTLRLAILTGIPFVMLCYVLLNLAFMTVLTHTEIGESIMVATKFVEKSLGNQVVFLDPSFRCLLHLWFN